MARERVRAGELTERGLARLCGISQPHMHNVLKNIRFLSTEALDRLMRALNVHITDLLWREMTDRDTGVRAVPLARNRIGPGSEAIFTATRGYYLFPEALVRDLVDPIAAQLGPDLVLPHALAARDLVLLDRNPRVRSSPSDGAGVWVVKDGASLSVRYVRMRAGHIYVGDESTRDHPERWHVIPLEGRNILDIVRARIVWIGREMEKEPVGPAYPAG